MTRKFFYALLFCLCAVALDAHASDSTSQPNFPSIVISNDSTSDSALSVARFPFTDYKSLLLTGEKQNVNDIEQYKYSYHNSIVFILLLLLLAVLTYVKVAFGNELSELLQAVVNQNFAQQIFRTQSGEISFSSFILHFNFIVVMSLYVRFFLVHYFHVSSLESFSSILFLIFLFTFFYLGKLIALQFIGSIFELKEVCNEYAFHFSTLCKTVGLTLIPALFIFYSAPKIFFDFVFIITLFIIAAFVLLLLWRGLSTGYKLLYSSVYHFFIYVCSVEISMMFLLFKLFTKTII